MSDRLATVYSESIPSAGDSLRCQLVVIEGPDNGRAVRLGDAEIVVGSDSSCDLVLADERVSGRHMTARAEEGRVIIRDLGSKNGVVLEGSLVGEAVVSIGATLKLGRSFLRVQPIATPVEVAPSQARRFGELVGESLAMREVFAVLSLAAAGDVTVLLEGETGTGKELAARALHEHSDRRRGPFVAIDCGSLPESLLESELFGHTRGAFTGATTRRAGAFTRAHQGTLFLDELATIGPAVQARLIRVLEERRVKPVGSDDSHPVDIRVIAATRDPLDARVADGEFRADLFYRLSVVRVRIPPLRARREDVSPIVAALLRRRGIEPGPVSGPNLDRLIAHDWPGNVRELRNVIERGLTMTPGARSFAELRLRVEAGAVEGEPLAVRSDLPYHEAKEAVLHTFERRYLGDLIARTEGNITAAARETGLDRKHLRTLLKKHGLI
jgi:DNA-binding NtrC family response regulator